MNTAIETLNANLAALTDKDRAFAQSLLDQATRRPLSDKQLHWIGVLAGRATGASEQGRAKTALGDMSGIRRLFDSAKRLKYPAIVIGIDGAEYRLSVASERSVVPGAINVAEQEGERWFGRILATGEFEASPRERAPTALIPGLVRFAADPARIAAEHGKRTGRCCFCNLPLGRGSDKTAASVGYGAKCASTFGLPKGNAASVRAQFAAA